MEQTNNRDSYFNIKQVLITVLGRWYLIVASLIIALVVAFFINRYAKPEYKVTTTLFVKKSMEEIDPMTLLFESRKIKDGVSNEEVFFKSFPVVGAALAELENNVSYYFGNRWKMQEIYPNAPIKVSLLPGSESVPYGKMWECYPRKNNQFLLKTGQEENVLFFGTEYTVEGFKFKVDIADTAALTAYEFIAFQPNSLFKDVEKYRNRINVRPVGEEVINVTFVHENAQKAKDFVNALADKVIERSMQQKKSSFDRTIAFIDDLIQQNYDSLRLIEGEIRKFKKEKVAVDPASEQSRIYGTINSLENEKNSIALTNEYYDYLLNTIENEDGLDELVIPSTLGIEDGILNGLVNRLINLQMDVKVLLEERKLKNPLLLENQELIGELKANIRNNIQNQKKNNDLRLNDINRRIRSYQANMEDLPEAEQELKNINRNYSLSENLYMMMLQKKMEAGIQSTVVSPDYTVINRAYDNGIVSSDPKRIYLSAIILALILPVGLILVIDFFDTRVKSKEEAAQLIPFPIIGSILHLDDQDERYHIASPLMESFRSLRSNLHYLGAGIRVIMTTSSVSGEGKSFCSQNLAYSLCLTGKKVLWIDADMRKVTYQEKAAKSKEPQPMGLSAYLAGMMEKEDTIQSGKQDNLWIVRAGALPPNPAELLINQRMQELMQYSLMNFDYIIIDTPPIGIFSDATELLPMVDYSLLILRHKYTRKPMVDQMMETIRQRQLRNVAVIYNDVKAKRGKYGYGYTDASQRKKKSPFKRKLKLK